MNRTTKAVVLGGVLLVYAVGITAVDGAPLGVLVLAGLFVVALSSAAYHFQWGIFSDKREDDDVG